PAAAEARHPDALGHFPAAGGPPGATRRTHQRPPRYDDPGRRAWQDGDMVARLQIWMLVASAAWGAPAIIQEAARVPMRDGVKLAAKGFRPQIAGKLPTVLIRTPYSKGKEITRGH